MLNSPFLRSPATYFSQKFQAGSVKGSVFTLTVAIVGAGSLSVPFAFQETGLILTLILFSLGALLAYFTLQMLVMSSSLVSKWHKTRVCSYRQLALVLYGKKFSKFVQTCLLMNLYGTSVSYLRSCLSYAGPDHSRRRRRRFGQRWHMERAVGAGTCDLLSCASAVPIP